MGKMRLSRVLRASRGSQCAAPPPFLSFHRHGPLDEEPNPLNFLYKYVAEFQFEDDVRIIARAHLTWFEGFLWPHWRDDLAQRAEDAFKYFNGAPNVVVFDLIHWDAAYSTLSRFEHELPDFPDELAAAFPPPTRFVYRTPTFFVGDDAVQDRNKGRRWMSTAKIRRMHELALKTLLASPLRSRLHVWDVFSIGEGRQLSKSLEQIGTCQNGHERAEDIQVENQVLLNLFCGDL